MKDKILLIILTVTLALSVITAVIAYILLQKLRRKEDIRVNLKMKKDFLYSSYLLVMKIALLKRYMDRIRRRIEILDLSDDWTIARKTMRFTALSLGVSLMVLVVLLLLSQNVYFVLISVFTV